MLVTVFSDASYCDAKHVGGWGAWAKSERGVVKRGGSLRGPLINSSQAEAFAAINAIYVAVTSHVFMAGDDILIQIDSLAAISALDGKGERQWAKDAQAALARLVAAYSITSIRTRHVKGHSRDGTPRTYVNKLCDGLARAGMQAARLA